MKTDDLVGLLARDDIVERSPSLAAAFLYPPCLVAVALLFFATLGPRAGFDTQAILVTTATKLAITLTLAVSGVVAALRAARPDAGARLGLLAAAPALLLLTLAIALDLSTSGVAGWQSRLVGLHGWRCLAAVTTFSLLPLAATLDVLRRGATTRRTMAGVVAGLAASGVGASFYALACTDDSPLFMLAWYGPATLIVVALGLFGARRLLEW
ncbi:MAG: DUF1109 domain-containing protein [Hyphomicrobiales bacterium]|nr:DUF1109 domain-containing protein [Hyphomicrobiales bacterium]